MAINIDKLEAFRDANNAFVEQGEVLLVQLDKLIEFLPRYFDEAKVHFANAPFPDGNDRNRMTHKAQDIGSHMLAYAELNRRYRNLVNSIVEAGKGANQIVERILRAEGE